MSLLDRIKRAVGLSPKDETRAQTSTLGAGVRRKPAPQMWFSARAYALVETFRGWVARGPDTLLEYDMLKKVRHIRKREQRSLRNRLAGGRLLWDSNKHGMVLAAQFGGYTQHPRATTPGAAYLTPGG